MDDTLMERIAAGDQQAFNDLYHRFQLPIFNLCYHYLQNREDAEELLQDVFITVFKSASKFKGRSEIATWLYRITVNKCLDTLKYRKAKKRFAFLTALFGETTSIADTEHREQDENTIQLYHAIDSLSSLQKTALILTQIQELSIKETATIMQTTPKAVESLTQRAKANLKKYFKK